MARADPDAAPSSLRPVLGFTKLPKSALAQVRRAAEDSPEFREMVAAAVEEDDERITRPAWLWLHRPEGWEEELASLVAEAEASSQAAADEKAERSATKRVAKAEAALQRAQAAAERASREAAEARAGLDGERRARRQAEEEVDRLRDRLVRLEAERDRLTARANEAETTVGDLRRERAALRERIADLERQAATVVDREAVAMVVGDATAALARAAELLEAPTPERPPQPRSSAPRREPTPLPGGVFDDRPEAAEHLMRVEGMTVLVDGYNASKLAWPDQPIEEQRRRLVDALAELVLRTGVDAHVVFDGADGEVVGRRAAQPVRVKFSPKGVTADDVILELVDAHPLGQPVTVASSDREVRDGARARGANTISSPQLLAVVGRYGLDP